MAGNRSLKNKNFTNEFHKILERFKKGHPFALSKYADGEWNIINETPHWGHVDGWYYLPYVDKFYRNKLYESFIFKHPDYIIGISCRCCAGDEVHEQMKKTCNQPDNNLTFANLFVNGNYNDFLNKLVPLFTNYTVYIIANKKAQMKKLPFKVKKHFMIDEIAWKNNYNSIEEIKQYIEKHHIEGALFLFASGPLGNMLAHQLFDSFPSNIYLDIGSTLNPQMDMGANRGYLQGAETSKRMCIWK